VIEKQTAEEMALEVRRLTERLVAAGRKDLLLKAIGVSLLEDLRIEAARGKLSRLVITEDYRFILADYNNKEVELQPVHKAVYLLFLNHPEGIMFKYLPDYREELAHIYNKVKPWGLTDRALQSIEDVTNPLLNSINEKCSRVKAAFIPLVDASLVDHYYIIGKGGEEKKIILPRNLVIWE
jgi:hypothetical protein